MSSATSPAVGTAPVADFAAALAGFGGAVLVAAGFADLAAGLAVALARLVAAIVVVAERAGASSVEVFPLDDSLETTGDLSPQARTDSGPDAGMDLRETRMASMRAKAVCLLAQCRVQYGRSPSVIIVLPLW